MAPLAFFISFLANIVIFKFPVLIYLSVFLWLACIVGIIFLIGSPIEKMAYVGLTIAFFILGYVLWLIFIENAVLKFFLAILASLAIGFSAWLVKLYTKEAKEIFDRALSNFLGYINLISFFTFSVAVLFMHGQLFSSAMLVFLYIGYYIVVLILSFLILHIYRGLRVIDAVHPKKSLSTSIFYAIIIVFCVMQLFWIIGFLPASYYLQAGFLFLVYYQITGLVRHYLTFGMQGLSRNVIVKYFLFFIAEFVLLSGSFLWRYIVV